MDHRGERFRRHPRRPADRGNEDYRRDPRDVEEIARLQQRIRDLEGQHEDPPDEETETDPFIREARRGHDHRFDHEEQGNLFAEQETRFDPLRALGGSRLIFPNSMGEQHELSSFFPVRPHQHKTARLKERAGMRFDNGYQI
ncbi:hypothetical protein E3N88_43504 [Mikania micrantha]|uniref:Uncharacterized protein n=1 Tax=Mikania micrantha TaxID=192012 RepID=A0A5N6LEW7_9ASTR|nr:hypothetical protein E3N88_43504 [Mikania micrantha]